MRSYGETDEGTGRLPERVFSGCRIGRRGELMITRFGSASRTARRFGVPARRRPGHRMLALSVALALIFSLAAAPIASAGDPVVVKPASVAPDEGGLIQTAPRQMVRPAAAEVADAGSALPAGLKVAQPKTFTLPEPLVAAESIEPAALDEVFADGFETWPGVWDAGTGGAEYSTATWGQTSHLATVGTYSAYCAGSEITPPGTYPSDMFAYMLSGSFDLSSYDAATLTFDLWLESENDWDLLWVGASTDGSAFNMVGWYGDSGGWLPMEVDLADLQDDGTLDYTGEPTVWIGFFFESDGSLEYEGAYIDDVHITAGEEEPPPPVDFPFEDGFETWPGPWALGPSSGTTWGQTTYRETEGTHSAYCVGSDIPAPGPYPNDISTWMTAGPFDLSGTDAAMLTFDMWLDAEQDYDGLMVGASTDGSLFDTVGWTGNTAVWEYDVQVDLADFFGDSTTDFTGESAVWIAFIFESDVSNTDEGAYVDDVRFTAEEPEPPLPPVLEVAGATRYETAVEASVLAYPDGLAPTGKRTVVIATGGNWPDALGGSALAGALDGPILLTDPAALPACVLTEIRRLDAQKAIILGGTAAVSTAVENALKAELGSAAGIVTRIAGAERYDTANKVALRVKSELGGAYDGHAFVATGGNFPDALAAAPLAAAKKWPLFLSNPATGLSAATRAAMAGTTHVHILGGTAVVSQAIEDSLEAAYGDANVNRLAGANRYETACKIADYGVDSAGLGWNRCGIATGINYPDALAGGVLQGKAGSVMLLTPSTYLCTETATKIMDERALISTITIFGGTGAVSQVVRTDLDKALDGTWTPPLPPPTGTDGLWQGYKTGYPDPVVQFNVKDGKITTTGSTLEYGASMIVVYPYSNVTMTMYVYSDVPIGADGKFSYTQGTVSTIGGQKTVTGTISSATHAFGTATHNENSGYMGFTGTLTYNWVADR